MSADVSKRASCITETKRCAQYLLPKVQELLASPVLRADLAQTESSALSLVSAVTKAEAAAWKYFRSMNLTSIKAITSGAPGGLGRKKNASLDVAELPSS